MIQQLSLQKVQKQYVFAKDILTNIVASDPEKRIKILQLPNMDYYLNMLHEFVIVCETNGINKTIKRVD